MVPLVLTLVVPLVLTLVVTSVNTSVTLVEHDRKKVFSEVRRIVQSLSRIRRGRPRIWLVHMKKQDTPGPDCMRGENSRFLSSALACSKIQKRRRIKNCQNHESNQTGSNMQRFDNFEHNFGHQSVNFLKWTNRPPGGVVTSSAYHWNRYLLSMNVSTSN